MSKSQVPFSSDTTQADGSTRALDVAKRTEKTSAARAANPFAPIASPIAVAQAAVRNPFATSTRVVATKGPIADGEPSDENAYYAMVASGPSLGANEAESNVPAVEVMVMWGERDILQVSHLCPPRAFVIGEERTSDKHAATPDFAMERDFLGVEQLVLTAPRGNGVCVFVPQGATLEVRAEGSVRDAAAMRATGELFASTTQPGSLEYALREGETARVTFKSFVFQVKPGRAGAPLAARLRPDPIPFYYVGGVTTLFASLFLLINFLLPPTSMLGGDQLDVGNRYVQALIEAREHPTPPTPATVVDGSESLGQAAANDSGEAGERDRPRTPNRLAVHGDARPENAALPQQTSVSMARDNVVTNAVATIATLFANGPSSSFSAENAVGSDAMSVLGALVGGQVGTSGGFNGLGAIGTGVGSGGPGLGTIGTGDGPHTIGGDRIGARGDGAFTDRVPHPPHVGLSTNTDVSGGLTQDQIRRVIQRNVAQVQHCYEQGLQRNPSLAGRVTVSFMIAPTGAVGASHVADSQLSDATVGSCVASAVRRWTFPQPEPAGPVSVRFPFNLSQSGN